MQCKLQHKRRPSHGQHRQRRRGEACQCHQMQRCARQEVWEGVLLQATEGMCGQRCRHGCLLLPPQAQRAQHTHQVQHTHQEQSKLACTANSLRARVGSSVDSTTSPPILSSDRANCQASRPRSVRAPRASWAIWGSEGTPFAKYRGCNRMGDMPATNMSMAMGQIGRQVRNTRRRVVPSAQCAAAGECGEALGVRGRWEMGRGMLRMAAGGVVKPNSIQPTGI